MLILSKDQRLTALYKKHALVLPTSPQSDPYLKHLDWIEKVDKAAGSTNGKDVIQYVLPVVFTDNTEIANNLSLLHRAMIHGANPWAACIAAAPDPLAAFVYLTREFDKNDKFAEWLTTPKQATAELKSATGWSDLELKDWEDVFTKFGAWKTVATPVPKEFTLGNEGPTFGMEVEVRNQDVTLEKRTPPTTELECVRNYLEKVQGYFIPIEGVLQASYWNLHFNMSLSRDTEPNVRKELVKFRKLAEMISVPANSYDRNKYRADKVDPDDTTSVHCNCQIKDDLDSNQQRKSKGLDKSRLEIKNFSISADTDIDYLIDDLRLLRLAADKPKLFDDIFTKVQILSKEYDMPTLKELRNLGKIPPGGRDSRADSFNEHAEAFRADFKSMAHDLIQQASPPPLPPEDGSRGRKVMQRFFPSR